MAGPRAAYPVFASADAPPADAASERLGVGRVLNGRYRLLDQLGRGGMGVVYRAQDGYDGREVALKMMRRGAFDTSSVELFKSEFRTLSTLSHPHITRVYDFAACSDSLDYFFTMELVPGADAASATAHATLEPILDVVVQVARALSYLHTRNILHLDLKPTNVLVTADFRAKVLDFGVARSPDLAQRGRYGTRHFMAPELLLEGAEVDRRADLYSLGVTLFRLLFGRLPRAESGEATFKVRTDELSLSAEERDRTPHWLVDLLRRLLAQAPSERYRTASEVIAAIERGRGNAVQLETTETSDSYVASARLVGLESVLRDIMGRLDKRLAPQRARRGAFVAAHALHPSVALPAAEETVIDTLEHPQRGSADETRQIVPVSGRAAGPQGVHAGPDAPLLIVCEGPEGSGKSRVLAEIGLECQFTRCQLVRAGCVADGLDPFEVWANIAQQLRLTAKASMSRASVPEGLPTRGSQSAARPPGDVASWASEVSSLLLDLAAPCLVIIDDLHWMSSSSLEVLELLLEELSRHHDGRAADATFLCAIRSELSDEPSRALARLERLGVSHRIRFPPLSPDQVSELVESMLGTVALPTGLAEAMANATRGNALQISELLRAWVADGTLRPLSAGWAFSRSNPAAEVPARIRRLFQEELELLSPAELELLQLLAALGEPAPLPLLEGLLGSDREALLARVEVLRARRIVFLARAEVLCFSAARWQSSVSSTWSLERAAALHRHIARFLEGRQPSDAAAAHYQKSADLRSAAECYARGAEEWLSQGDLRRALRCFQRAVSCGASESTLGRACSAAAEASRLLGERAQAAALAQRALQLLPTDSGAWMRASRVAIAAFNPAPQAR